jgi:hypothetical protein
MDPIGPVTPSLELLIAECATTWSFTLASALSIPTASDAVALRTLIESARAGRVATLPYLHAGKRKVFWLSFGGDSKSLLEYGEDLRSWVMPAYGTQGDLALLQAGSKGNLAKLVDEVSPAGYLRWTSDLQSLPTILTILARMNAFLQGMPAALSAAAPSLHVLRFRFVAALRLGHWATAVSIVDEIDRWSLEQAHKTMQMRLRVLGESGNHAQVLELVERHRLWALAHPTRVAETILSAVVHEVVLPLEAMSSPAEVCEGLRPWYPKLVSVLPRVAPADEFSRLFAYVACLDQDATSATALLPMLDEQLKEFVRDRLGLKSPEEVPLARSPISELPPPAGDGSAGERPPFWASLKVLVRHGAGTAVRKQLDALDAKVLDDGDFLAQAPDALLELISDPSVDSRPASGVALQEVLTALIDTTFSVPEFPCLKHLDLYLSLAESLIYLRGATANDEDAHLLHGLLAAIANLSPKATRQCTELLRSWWQQRPILSRLDWLMGVLDSLAPLHPEPDSMLGLWSEALALAMRKRAVLSPTQFRTWQRVARLLEIPADSVASDLDALRPPASQAQTDPLQAVGWRKIAIVSLQEGAAREAARELGARTGAEVVLVTSLVQDGLTKAAQLADVVLLVWAACSHAVYRAFDDRRDRLVYVQGTGTSSILAAAERWAEQRIAETQASDLADSA